MITFESIADFKKDGRPYDRVCVIDRVGLPGVKRREIEDNIEIVDCLIPTDELDKYKMSMTMSNSWNISTFNDSYVTTYLESLAANKANVNAVLNSIWLDSKNGKEIAVISCALDGLCQRSIIASLMVGAKAEVENNSMDVPVNASLYDKFEAMKKASN